MSQKKLQNYFQALEEKDDNDDVDNISNKQPPKSKKSTNKLSNNKIEIFNLHSELRDRDAAEIQTKIKNHKQINVTNFRPAILKALSDALKNTNTVETILIKDGPGNTIHFLEDAALHLREIMSSPGIKFQITTPYKGTSLKLLQGLNTVKNITHLDVKIESTVLDELLCNLSSGAMIVDMRINRSGDRGNLNNLAKFRNIQQLQHLEIPVYGDECEPLFEALKNNSKLHTLSLAKSDIPAKFAPDLADLIAQNSSITSLRLSECKMDSTCFSMICKALLSNNTVQTLDIDEIRPEAKVDLSIVGEITKKRLNVLKVSSYDSSLTNIFRVNNLVSTTYDIEHLKTADISALTITQHSVLHPLKYDNSTSIEHINDLFAVLNENTRIMSVTLRKNLGEHILAELLVQLMMNKTLKRFVADQSKMMFGQTEFDRLCEMIETNSTLEEFACTGDIEVYGYNNNEDLLKVLKNNKTLTTIGLGPIICKIEAFHELLTANPYISFANDSNWPSGQKLTPIHRAMRDKILMLNQRNKQNAKKRIWRMKMNVMILARSRWSRVLPIEVWQEIIMYVDARMDYFELFLSSAKNNLASE